MKILYITTVSLTFNSFFKPHIEMLVNSGHHVDIACNYNDLALDGLFEELGCNIYQIDFSRFPLSPDNLKASKQLKRLIVAGKYDIVHCHTPNASVVTRLVCRKLRKRNALKVFYTAHGFHFYKGAPKLNWMVYYPVEKFCSRFTDKLITINKEDYELAKSKFKAKEICYIPGVGVDLSRFENVSVDKAAKRSEIGVPADAFLLISVGEVNENKNHQIIVKALARLKNPNIHYAIAGEGDKKDYLHSLANELGVADQVHLLGYRKDVPELNHSADVFCFPSVREGLGLAAVEAMTCGIPVIAANNRGTSEFIVSKKNGFLCEYDDEKAFAEAIADLSEDTELYRKLTANLSENIEQYDIKNILSVLKGIYENTQEILEVRQ